MRVIALFLLTCVVALFATSVRSLPTLASVTDAPAVPRGNSDSGADALAPFAALIGGEWRLDETIQSFEWGLDRRSVISRSWFEVDGERRLVSEGMWLWHPGAGAIRGWFTATDMPVEFFDYASRFEGDTLASEITAYAPGGGSERYLETIVVGAEGRYEWTLYQTREGARRRVMGGTFVRSGGQ